MASCVRRGAGEDDAATQKETIVQIYKKWANHYLERGHYKRTFRDLQSDLGDGTLLADVIEAVTGSPVPNITRKPKGTSQMVSNIESCLTFLGHLGVGTDGVTTKDIVEGNLKAILGLFFNLSRYKEAQKKQQEQAASGGGGGVAIEPAPRSLAPSVDADANMLSKLPSPFKRAPKEGCIPVARRSSLVPSSSPSPRNSLLQQVVCNGPVAGSKPSSATNSRAGSPHRTGVSGGAGGGSFIPQPRGAGVVVSRERSAPVQARPTSASHLPVKSGGHGLQAPNGQSHGHHQGRGGAPAPPSGISQPPAFMLDKFKHFTPKDKNAAEKSKGLSGTASSSTASKRTSSSSGFSSARSERSDSSASLCSGSEPRPSADGAPAATSSAASFPAHSGRESHGRAATTQPSAHPNKSATGKKGGTKPTPPPKTVSQKEDPRRSSSEHESGKDESSIPKPTLAVRGTAKQEAGAVEGVPSAPSGPLGVDPTRSSLPRSASSSSGPRGGRDGIAMVSPIMSSAKEKANELQTPSPSDIPGDTPAKSLVLQHSSSSEGSNPPPSSTKDRHNHHHHHQQQQQQQQTDEGGEADVMVNIKPMPPILRASPYGYTRSLSTSSGSRVHAASSGNSAGTGRLFGVSLKRVLEDCGGEVSGTPELAGYLSDGDVLRPSLYRGSNGVPLQHHHHHDDIGYVSEGGASLHGRRGGSGGRKDHHPLHHHHFATTINVLQDDSLDDSSSLSSGVSDTFNELSTDDNLTGSSLSSDPYGSLHRVAGGREPHDRHPHASSHQQSSSHRPRAPKKDSCMQTESSAFQNNSVAWKKYLAEKQRKAPGNGCKKSSPLSDPAPYKGSKSKLSLAKEDKIEDSSSKDKKRSTGSGQQSGSSKRPPAGSPCPAGPPPNPKGSSSSKSDKKGEMARASTASPAGPKTTLERKGKVKVCANTQTTVHDLYMSSSSAGALSDSEYSSLGRKQFSGTKQYFLTSPTTAGLRRTLNGSDYVTLAGLGRHGFLPRLSVPPKSGSESDNYVSLDSGHYTWLRPMGGSSAASVVSAPAAGGRGMTLTEAESLESLNSSIHSQMPSSSPVVVRGGGGGGLTHARLLIHQRELSPSPRLSRSNSIRSTKSEKLYPSMLQRSEDPTSPTGAQSLSRYGGFPLSPGHPGSCSTASSSHGGGRSSLSHYMLSKKDDDLHGSSLSLVSTSSSLYSTAEEKQAHEIRKLRRELEQSNEKVATLTSQLTTNAHMVAAFEQSLSNMTSRLQHLTVSAEQKDSELHELRGTIEALKKQSAEAGLTKVALQSMQAVQRSTPAPHLVRRHTFNTTKESLALQEHRISRQLSTDSVSSVNSISSACSGASKSDDSAKNKNKKKKGWLRSSFSKAFSRSKKNRNGSVSDVEDARQFQSDSSVPNSPMLGLNHKVMSQQQIKAASASALDEKDGECPPELVVELRKQLREKDMILTDIRLEALTSAHQLEGLRDTVTKMRTEMMNLKHDNDRLQRLVSNKILTSSQSSLPLRNSIESLDKRLSISEQSESQSIDLFLNDAATDRDGKRVVISVYLGSHGDYSKFLSQSAPEISIGSVSISGKTKWDLLDNVVKRTFKEYVLRVDPVSNLGLNAESVLSYHVADVVRSKESDLPELLPCGYVVGENTNVRIVIKGTSKNSVDALAFETLIPKSIIQRYISLLTEHRRIILCGPSGTGKTYLAQKLSEYLVLKTGREVTPGAIATFSVDHKSAKELRQYLANVAEQCESSNPSDLPTVIILDNLHHVGSLGEVFNGFLSAKYLKCPFIIGTMNQATCSTTNLQLHHNFRWVLCANHMEPVKGFLGRYLRRKLVEEEVRTKNRNPDLTKVIDWMPNVWQHLNKFLETHSSSDVTIGPRLFLSCPLDVNSSQVWFTDLWNYSIIPYLLEAVREGLQLYGRRAPWEDPAGWVLDSYPWPSPSNNTAANGSSGEWPQLLRLRPEDVGYEGHPGPGGNAKNIHSGGSDVETDPLLNMLMRLQEAATYSSPHSNDSDSTSLESGSLHPDDLMHSGMESTL